MKIAGRGDEVDYAGKEEGIYSGDLIMTWMDDSEWINLSASIKEGVTVAFSRNRDQSQESGNERC